MRRVKLKYDVHHVYCQATTNTEPSQNLIDYDGILKYKTVGVARQLPFFK